MRYSFEQAIYDALGSDADVTDVASALWYYGEDEAWRLLQSDREDINISEELIKAFEAVTDEFGPGWRVVEYRMWSYGKHSPSLRFGKLKVDDHGVINRVTRELDNHPDVSCEWVPADMVCYYIIPKGLVEYVKGMLRQDS
jgi:hypothetical protein